MNKKKHTFLLGSHLSIVGGFYQVLERGHALGCTAIQFFTKSNRQWYAKPLVKAEIEKFLETKKKYPEIKYTIVHAAYIINLASDKPTHRAHSITSLTKELLRCQELQVPYLVLHPGSCGTLSRQQGMDFIVEGLNKVLAQANGTTMILLETMAGQGSALGKTFEEIAYIRKSCNFQHLIGVCLDTCHVFVSHYDFSTTHGYEEMWRKFDETIGISHLKTIHINDSKKGHGSGIDRHEHIGQGAINPHGFKLLFNDKRLFDIPKILETPKDSPEDDPRNIHYIRMLLSHETKEEYGI